MNSNKINKCFALIIIVFLLMTAGKDSYFYGIIIQDTHGKTQPDLDEEEMVEYIIIPTETVEERVDFVSPEFASDINEASVTNELTVSGPNSQNLSESNQNIDSEIQPEVNEPSSLWGMSNTTITTDDWGALNNQSNITKTPGFVTNLFYDTPLRNALSEIALQAEVIIIPDASVEGLVTCDLKDVPLKQALEIVLSSGNFVFRQMDGYILVGTADIESPSFSKLCVTERVKLNYIKAEDAVKMLSKPLQNLVTANSTDNVISVSAPQEVLEKIVQDLRKFDQPCQHVLLDARIVSMENGNLLNLGIQWDWPNISIGTFSDSDHHGGGSQERVSWPWGIQIGYTPGQEFTNSLLLTLNLLSQNDEATVIASPQVLAQDGKEAEIKVVTQEYFKITQESYTYTRFELENIETGTILTITPQIGQNSDITLNLATEVSNVLARGEDNLPVVTRRTTKNTVRLKNGGTAVIAGLTDNRKRLEQRKTPGLSGLPLMGSLFDKSSEVESSRQVAVFITARLMDETEPVIKKSFKEMAAIKPVGSEFKAALKEALSKLNPEE